MFVNRQNELEALDQAWQRKNTNLFVVYGRRRVGKTELIKQFLKTKSGFYFLADRLPEKENLKTLSRIVRDFFKDEFLGDFNDWYSFFRYLKSRIKKKMVLIIDEFPYLLETNSALSSVFQKGWDEYLKDKPIFLILCGSSIGMMHKEALAYKAPLYGRRTGQLFVKPLLFADFQQFFPSLSFQQQLEFYTITGGIPAYILQLDSQLNLIENIKANIFNSGSYLYEEINFILKEEVREPRIYFSILKSIVHGKRKLGEIVNETGIQKTSLHSYLYTLEELGFVEKEYPVTEKNPVKSRKGLYQLTDNFFRFWFNFLFPYHSEIELGNLKPALNRLQNNFVHLAAYCYEKIAVEILMKQQNHFFAFYRIGRWWDRNNEIDIVAFDEMEKNILVAEVKWSTNPLGINIYRDLVEKAAYVAGVDQEIHYALFSRSGFTEELQKVARQEKLILFEGGKIV